MPRVALCLVLAALSSRASYAHAQDASDWVGIWAPTGVLIQLRVDLELATDGTLTGYVNREGNNPGDPIEAAQVSGGRLELTLVGGDRLALELGRDGRSARVRGSYGGDHVAYTLRRRGSVWNAARTDTLDALHAGEQPSSTRLEAAGSIEEGLRRVGRADALADMRQGMCAYERLLPEWNGRQMAAADRGALLGRVAGSRSLCEVHPSELADPGGCERLTILDSDGATTVRASGTSRSESHGTVTNGTGVVVVERRSGWVRIEEPTAGWVHTSNTHCARAR